MKQKQKENENRSFMKRIGEKKGLVTVGLIAVLLVVFFVVRYFQGISAESETEASYAVHIVREEDPVLFDGKVQAAEVQEAFYDPSKGVIAEVLVEDGQSVEEGTDLFTYTNEENQQLLDEQNRQYSRLEERRSEAETDLANAKAALNTANANIKKANQAIQSSTESSETSLSIDPAAESAQTELMDYEAEKAEAEATIDSSEMTIEELTVQVEDIVYEIERLREGITTTIQSEFAGIVELSSSDPTSLQTSEQPVVRLMSNNLKIESTVSEYDYSKLSEDSPVDIYLMNSDRELSGTISNISSLPVQANAEGETSSRYPFTVIPEESVQYGFSVQIGYSEGVIYLPQNTVIEAEDGTNSVFVNEDGTVEKREVVLKEESHFYEVESGLEVDEEVLLDPDPALVNGDEVTVMYD